MGVPLSSGNGDQGPPKRDLGGWEWAEDGAKCRANEAKKGCSTTLAGCQMHECIRRQPRLEHFFFFFAGAPE